MIFSFFPSHFCSISQTHAAVLEWKDTEETGFTAYIPVCLLIWYFKIQIYSYKWCLTARRIYLNTQFLISLLLTLSKQGDICI